MKKFILVTMCVLLCFTLSACFQVDNREDEYPGDYHDGYVDGYDDGYYEGQKDLGFYASSYFSDVCGWTYGIEEAVVTLSLYIDEYSGESFTEEEIEKAILEVERFYTDVRKMVIDIEKYYR